MKTPTRLALLAALLLPLDAALARQEITMPSVAEAAATFSNPPKEYGAIHWALGFPPGRERILSDIERVSENGGGGYMMNSGGRQPKYFSAEYFALFRLAVDECRKRGLKIWIDGDDGYPDGFAGGMISRLYPQLGMQGIVADARYTVAGGQTLRIPLPVDTLGILASPRSAGAEPDPAAPAPTSQVVPLPDGGDFKWTAPGGGIWEVAFQGSAGEARYSVASGQTLTIPLPPGTKGILATTRPGRRGGPGGRGGPGERAGRRADREEGPPSVLIALPADGAQFEWLAPGTGMWEVTFVRHVYRSSPTRYGQREDGTRDKDSLYSLIDYLDPQATATYLKLIQEGYAKVAGDEFGTTILGFRGDETDYTGFMPWTPKLLETFKMEKGYDLQPYIARFFATPLTPEAQRAKADYWDVWSGMFRDNFYKPMEEWCRAHNMDYMLHLNHEETMVSRFGGEDMVRNEGSFWRDMRYVGVPGVDNLNQIGPGIVADFPKIAGSAAHLFGRPQAWSEEGGGTGQGGKFVFDYQLVRGLNYMNIRGLNEAPPAVGGALLNPNSAIGRYISRAQHLMAIGRPAAQVALFHPTDSFWMGDKEADDVQVRLVTELMERQIDFDHIDSDALASVCSLDRGGLRNLSGQVYRAVIVPTSTVIQEAVLERLRAFAAGGGKVVFVGRTPTLVAGRSFLYPEPGAPDLSFATLEPTPEITARVVAALPEPDVRLDAACPPIKYIHRSLSDGDAYLFFNESNQVQTRTATLAGSGRAQVWDATTGTIHPLAGVAPASGRLAVPLVLEPQEARFIVIGPLPDGAARPWPTLAASQTVANLDGAWSVTLGERQTDTPLKSWQDLGAGSFAGTADYRMTFNPPALPEPGRRVYLDLGNVGEIARVRLNGTEFDARGWPPYVWDVTDSLKSGANSIEVQVQVPAEGGRGGGRARGAAAALGAGRAPGMFFPDAPPAVPPARGLLGPVRLIAQ
ncbi:MAG: glycosyl hydrolase [Opitutaceae bacterium]|jgi:hypothetical protein